MQNSHYVKFVKFGDKGSKFDLSGLQFSRFEACATVWKLRQF